MKVEFKFGVTGDTHARINLISKHKKALKKGEFCAIFNLGDIEASYIDKDHQLRKGQNPEEESTMDAIIRNALDSEGNLTKQGKKSLKKTINSISSTALYLDLWENQTKRMRYGNNRNDRFDNYKIISGNSVETWINIIKTIDCDSFLHIAYQFTRFKSIIRESRVNYVENNFLFDQEYHSNFHESDVDEIKSHGNAIIYLPWKCSMESVHKSIDELSKCNLKKVVIMSHDYLTSASIAKRYQNGIKPMQNEEQVVAVLDELSKSGAEIEGFFGHIGFEYEPFQTTFNHKGKQIITHHVDELGGKLTPLKFPGYKQ